jgi:hypothetical protein
VAPLLKAAVAVVIHHSEEVVGGTVEEVLGWLHPEIQAGHRQSQVVE